jgi:hypothetical protein
MPASYTVALVVDPAFGEELSLVAARVHTWAVDTPDNRRVAERVWADLPAPGQYNIENGITTFTPHGAGPDDWCISVIDELDLHHNNYSHDPGYTVLEVYGVTLSAQIRESFEEYGFVRFDEIVNGFIARKDEP